MGKIKNEHKIIVGGVENPTRDNVIIILRDIDDEEGHGVYIDSPGDGECSFTNSFGYGPFAEHTADILFEAVVNYYEDAYAQFESPIAITEIELENEEFNDSWIKIVSHIDPEAADYGEVDLEHTHMDGLQHLFAFMAKWGFKENKV